MKRWLRTEAEVSCGNAGAVESVESQKQASHSFHEPVGNLAKHRRDSHISTAPATRADGKVENQKQVFHFPTAFFSLSKKRTRDGRASRPARLEMKRLLIYPKTKGGISRRRASGTRRHFQAHRPLETKSYFRLILYWKRTQFSGSSLDWKMLIAGVEREYQRCWEGSRFDGKHLPPAAVVQQLVAAWRTLRWIYRRR